MGAWKANEVNRGMKLIVDSRKLKGKEGFNAEGTESAEFAEKSGDRTNAEVNRERPSGPWGRKISITGQTEYTSRNPFSEAACALGVSLAYCSFC